MKEKLREGTLLVGIDPGSEITGACTIDENAHVTGYTMGNCQLVPWIRGLETPGVRVVVVVEDIRPHNTRLGMDLVNTAKYIGELTWRLRDAGVEMYLIPRVEVRRWAFYAFPEICRPRIQLRMDRVRKKAAEAGETVLTKVDGRPKEPTWLWVDDQILKGCMISLWGLVVRRGRSKVKGLKDHEWQALGVASCFLYEKNF